MQNDWDDENVDDGYQSSDGMSSENGEESAWDNLLQLGKIGSRNWNYGLRTHWMTVEDCIYRCQLIVFTFLCNKREVELWNAEVNSRRSIERRGLSQSS